MWVGCYTFSIVTAISQDLFALRATWSMQELLRKMLAEQGV